MRLLKILSLATVATVATFASCATTPIVPVSEGPLLSQASSSDRIVVAVADLNRTRTPYALLQVDEFSAKTPAPGLTVMWEIREPSPNLLNRVLPGRRLEELVGQASAAALRGEVPYRLLLEAPGFRRLAVTPEGAVAASVEVVPFPEGADPAAFARDQGALTVLIRGAAGIETGRASSRRQKDERAPVQAVWGDLLLRTDLTLTAEVRDAHGELLFGGSKGTLGLRPLRPWSSVWSLVEGVKNGSGLDEWAGSDAFRERIALAAVQALGPVLPALAPHQTGEGR